MIYDLSIFNLFLGRMDYWFRE